MLCLPLAVLSLLGEEAKRAGVRGKLCLETHWMSKDAEVINEEANLGPKNLVPLQQGGQQCLSRVLGKSL